MCDSMHPAKEDDGPGHQLMEGDVLVELDDAVQRRLPCQRDERSTYREDEDRNVEVEDQGSGSRNRVGNTKSSPRRGQIVFHVEIQEAERVHHTMDSDEQKYKQPPVAFIDHPAIKFFSPCEISRSFTTHLP